MKEPEEDWGEHFSGKPFQGMGNVLDAIYHGGYQPLLTRLTEFMEKGDVCKECVKQTANGEIILLQYPFGAPANFGVLLHKNDEEQTLDVVSTYPVLEGLLNRLETLNYKAWENGLEGMAAANTKNFGSIQFFDPYFFIDANRLKKKQNQVFQLAALAMTAQVAKVEEFEISSGPYYEKSLAQFLKENPDKSEQNFKKPVINTGSLQMLIPTEYTGEYQFRALALAREEIPFLDQKLWRYQLVFSADTEDQSPEMWLYAAEHMIQGRVPLIGDYIEGFLWLQGYLERKK